MGVNLKQLQQQMIEQSKSPKSLAYARLGKAPSGKTSLQEHRKPNRNSTGNIFEDVLQQIPAADNAYIRELVTKNEREVGEHSANQHQHSRKKSYADMAVDQERLRGVERTRDERETLGKSKHPENFLMQVATPKNSCVPANNRTGGRQDSKPMIGSFKKEPQPREGAFLANLNNYLQELSEAPESNTKISSICGDKLSETLKVNSGEGQPIRMAARLQQCQTKIKELKLKNHYQEKQLEKQDRREAKMREYFCQMRAEMKQLDAELNYQKRQRKKLEKIIDSFDMRRASKVSGKAERKTIGKLHNLNFNQFDDEHTEDFDREIDDFRDFLKRSVDKKASTGKFFLRNGLDLDRAQKLFRSHQNSEDSVF